MCIHMISYYISYVHTYNHTQTVLIPSDRGVRVSPVRFVVAVSFQHFMFVFAA